MTPIIPAQALASLIGGLFNTAALATTPIAATSPLVSRLNNALLSRSAAIQSP